MDFSALKKKSNFENMKKAVEQTTGAAYKKTDDRIWQPDVDKAGNGMAIVRFLPLSKNDKPFVANAPEIAVATTWNHGFKGIGGWFIENCPTTIDGDCPACEYNTTLWRTGDKTNVEIARSQKRKMVCYANVLIISDPKHPENNGEVKIFKFGKSIRDKIFEVIIPDFDDETPLNPFHIIDGADFKIKIRNLDGYRNYDKSEFDTPSPLLGGDEDAIKEVWDKQYTLSEFLDPANFKSYDALSTRFYSVIGGAAKKASQPAQGFNNETFDSVGVDGDDLDYFKSMSGGVSGGRDDDDDVPF